MKICVLQPDYSTSTVDYGSYDPRRDLSRLLPEDEVDHVALNKLTTYRQLKALSRRGYDVFINLCEGYLEWDVPSIDVIHSLELLNLPYTGPTPALYDPPKVLMKYVAHTVGVATPAYALLNGGEDVERATEHLRFPLFVKPAKAGDSLGVDALARVEDVAALRRQVDAVSAEYPELLVEEYVAGREFTVLVAANVDGHGSISFAPVEYRFPAGVPFKTYALKTSELHPEANVRVCDDALAARLRRAAERVFEGFGGVGYARVDLRMDERGELFFLEINFTCSVFYTGGYEGSADHILAQDGIGQAGFARHIVAEGIARHRRRQKPYVMRGSPIAGFGIHAARPLSAGDVVFRGEGRAQRIVTRGHVRARWSAPERELFRHYAYPLSDEVYVLWDEDPSAWAPQNHSCAPNTGFAGLDVVTLRAVDEGEELTLDFAELLNEDAAPFRCNCGAPNCRGFVTGTPGNSVSAREAARRPRAP